MAWIENMDAEGRCGYMVSACRKRLWNAELEIYEYFKEVCSRYGLKHFLIAGSALGGVRHHGFIPWDDDIDIGMVRTDFDVLVKIAPKEFMDQYTITYGILENRVSPLLRIRDKETTGIIYGERGTKHNKGVFIEIYVYDFVPDDEEERKKQIDRVEALTYSANFKIQRKTVKTKDDVCLWCKLLGKSPEKLWNDVYVECTKYPDGGWMNTVITPIYARTNEQLITRKMADRIIPVKFENSTAYILEDSDALLKRCFGDYMQLPPVEERGMHHQQVVFYDPDHPYDYYENNSVVEEFFAGKFHGLL